MPSPSPTPPKRIGLREIASAADVGMMTASLSLRNSPKISAATRMRVQAAARRLGYRPDPEISRLMGRLRSWRTIQGGVVIGLLDLRPDPEAIDEPYDVALRRGATTCAEALGFGVTRFRLADYHGQLKQMVRVIRSRGITGLLLLPSSQSMALDPKVTWDGLSVVAATTSVTAPRFHRVVPHQLYNMMKLLDDLDRRGYRRIGAIFSEGFAQRTGQLYSAALAWHGHRERILVLPPSETGGESARRVSEWRDACQPDLIIAQRPMLLSHLQRASDTRGLGLVSLDHHGGQRLAYLDERPDTVGRSAASLLIGMMHNNETGIPRQPHTTTVDGGFHDGPTIRSTRGRARAK